MNYMYLCDPMRGPCTFLHICAGSCTPQRYALFMARGRRAFLSTMVGGVAGTGLVVIARPGKAAASSSGRYVFAGGTREENRRREAVEAVVSEVNVMIRGLARDRILEGTAPKTPLDIHIDPSSNQGWLDSPSMPRIAGPLNGSPFSWRTAKGDRNSVTMSWGSESLLVRFLGDGADSRYQYRFQPDQGRMTLAVVIRHRMMPSPLRFRQSYRRRT